MHLKVQLVVALRESAVLAKAYRDSDIVKLWSVKSPYSMSAHVISLQTKIRIASNVVPCNIILMRIMIIINQRIVNLRTERLQATCFATWLMQSMYMIRIMTAS